jgi:glutamate synthase (NADPH/NADH) small chain
MGKITGFIEHQRQLPILQDAKARIGEWSEFHRSLPEKDLNSQASRCMNCGIPFCHSETVIAGVTSGCPLNNLIPEWNDLVYRGQWQEAYKRLALTNNFPEFTGRVCPAPCESACVLGINEEPVMIKEIEVAIVDRAFKEGWVKANPPKERTGKRVAIIGSGPAGLACADNLNKSGHFVKVFEKDDRLGGLLMYGIPNMKLEKTLVERRIDLLKDEGIDFQTSVNVGVEITAEQLRAEFDAIVLACGSPKPRDFEIEGRNLRGIHFAMDFLTKNTQSLLNSNFDDQQFIDARDKNVIVIGGGDTGTDCIASSLRHGCRSVTQFEILEQPLEKVLNHDSWLSKVRTFQTDYGQEEANAVFATDPREFAVMTRRFIGDENGNLNGVETVNIEWKNSKSSEIAGSEKVWKAEKVFLAMGFTGIERGKLFEELGVEITDRNTIFTNSQKQTSVKGIFAAGDCERGQSLIVWAIADGRKAAKGVDKFLQSV